MDGISDDTLLDGRVRLRQPVDGLPCRHRSGLSGRRVRPGQGEMVLDLGSGVGAASLCLAARVPGVRIFGLEMQASLVALARENIELNGFVGRIEALMGRLQAPPPRLAPGSFHHVMTNPPYGTAGNGIVSPHPGKAAANQEGDVDLGAWMRFAVNMLQPKGTWWSSIALIAWTICFAALHGKVGEIVIYPLWPKQGRPAKRVLLRAGRASPSPPTLLPGLVLHEDDGRFTEGADAESLRHGAALD